MRVSPVTAASATAAFLITIIAGAGQARMAVESLRDESQASRTIQQHQNQGRHDTTDSATSGMGVAPADDGQRAPLQPQQ